MSYGRQRRWREADNAWDDALDALDKFHSKHLQERSLRRSRQLLSAVTSACVAMDREMFRDLYEALAGLMPDHIYQIRAAFAATTLYGIDWGNAEWEDWEEPLPHLSEINRLREMVSDSVN